MVIQSQDLSLGLIHPNPDYGPSGTQEKGCCHSLLPTKGYPLLLLETSSTEVHSAGRRVGTQEWLQFRSVIWAIFPAATFSRKMTPTGVLVGY